MICNASPLIFLSKIGGLNLLNDLFAEVLIPDGAWKEATRKPDGVTGTLGILIAGHRRGLVADVSAEINALRKVGFRVSDSVITQINKQT